MKILGCDPHTKQQTIAMVDAETGEFSEKTLAHEGNKVREFYAALEGPVLVGIEATGAMQWFLELLEELGIESRVGDPAKIRAAETRKQKHDRRDAQLILDLLTREDRFPAIWMPSIEERDLRTLLRGRHQWEDANASAEHVASDCAQSRAATRPRSVDSSGAESAAGLGSASLHKSKTRPNAELLRAVAAADPEAGAGGERTSAAPAPGAPLADTSGCGTSDRIGDEVFLGDPRRFAHGGEAHAGMPDYNSGPALQ